MSEDQDRKAREAKDWGVVPKSAAKDDEKKAASEENGKKSAAKKEEAAAEAPKEVPLFVQRRLKRAEQFKAAEERKSAAGKKKAANKELDERYLPLHAARAEEAAKEAAENLAPTNDDLYDR